MGDSGQLVVKGVVDDAVRAALTEDPAWTRLEPQSISGNPSPGLEARVYDPLWLLCMQWRLGEFAGEDAGSPVVVEVAGTSHAVVTWQPGDPASATPRPVRVLPRDVPLDRDVEREAAVGPGIRQRAEAGADLLEQLDQAAFDTTAFLTACAFNDGAAVRDSLPSSLRCVYDAIPDGLRAATALEGAAPGLPAWLAGASAQLQDAVRGWLDWFRENVVPSVVAADDSWIAERLEYRFAIEAGASGQSTVLRAPAYGGAEIDWFCFDVDGRPALDAALSGVATDSVTFDRKVLATPLRYAGMPANRYWQFEDGQVNFGQLDAQPHDLARMCLVEFALIYGNDWLVIPVDLQPGTLSEVRRVRYVDTFDVQHEVPRVADAFRLFEISQPGGGSLPALFLPPAALNTIEGAALEEVQFVRDETANLVWALERVVQTPGGDSRSRSSEPRADNAARRANQLGGADYDYIFATAVPPNWIPFVPVSNGVGSFFLRKGTLADNDDEPAQGALIAGLPFDLMDEEVPREGVRVRRVPSLARAADGRYLRWIARRVGVGKGEAASGLAYDSAVPPRDE